MVEYRANTFTSIFPFGIVAKGDILTEKQLDALGEATVNDMVVRGVLTRTGEKHDEMAETHEPEADETQIDTPNDVPEEAPDDGLDEDAEALEPDTMDDVVDETEAPEAIPDEKPKKNGRGRKAK